MVRDRRGAGDVAALAVAVPLALGMIATFAWLGRQTRAAQGVTHAAAAAARAATMERSAQEATAAARAVATAVLAGTELECIGGPAVEVSAQTWQSGAVAAVTVTCTVEGMVSIGSPARTMVATAHSVIDRFQAHRGDVGVDDWRSV